MDTKIRRRRIDVAREAGRRRLWWLLIIGGVVVVALVALGLLTLPPVGRAHGDVTGDPLHRPGRADADRRRHQGRSDADPRPRRGPPPARGPARGSSGQRSRPRLARTRCASTSPSARRWPATPATDGQCRVIDDDGPGDRRPRRPADRLPGHRPAGTGGRPGAGRGADGHRRRRALAAACPPRCGQVAESANAPGELELAPEPQGDRAARLDGRHAGQAHQRPDRAPRLDPDDDRHAGRASAGRTVYDLAHP